VSLEAFDLLETSLLGRFVTRVRYRREIKERIRSRVPTNSESSQPWRPSLVRWPAHWARPSGRGSPQGIRTGAICWESRLREGRCCIPTSLAKARLLVDAMQRDVSDLEKLVPVYDCSTAFDSVPRIPFCSQQKRS
jgi:hypothetical protein